MTKGLNFMVINCKSGSELIIVYLRMFTLSFTWRPWPQWHSRLLYCSLQGIALLQHLPRSKKTCVVEFIDLLAKTHGLLVSFHTLDDILGLPTMICYDQEKWCRYHCFKRLFFSIYINNYRVFCRVKVWMTLWLKLIIFHQSEEFWWGFLFPQISTQVAKSTTWWNNPTSPTWIPRWSTNHA